MSADVALLRRLGLEVCPDCHAVVVYGLGHAVWHEEALGAVGDDE